MGRKNTIESRVAAAILDRNIGCIDIDGVNYDIAPPSIGTLILVSELIAELPVVENVDNNIQKVNLALHYGRDFRVLGDIAAVLILGAKNLTEEKEIIVTKRGFLGLFKRKVKQTITIDKQAELAAKILENVSPSVLHEVIIKRLHDMEIGSFFLITTSLSAANILRPTRGVGQ